MIKGCFGMILKLANKLNAFHLYMFLDIFSIDTSIISSKSLNVSASTYPGFIGIFHRAQSQIPKPTFLLDRYPLWMALWKCIIMNALSVSSCLKSFPRPNMSANTQTHFLSRWISLINGPMEMHNYECHK